MFSSFPRTNNGNVNVPELPGLGSPQWPAAVGDVNAHRGLLMATSEQDHSNDSSDKSCESRPNYYIEMGRCSRGNDTISVIKES